MGSGETVDMYRKFGKFEQLPYEEHSQLLKLLEEAELGHLFKDLFGIGT